MQARIPVPGYYVAAYLAGAVSVKAPAAPMTNTGVAGIESVLESNNTFSDKQLDIIAGGGTWVLEQRAPFAIFNRHQLSTDATTVQTRELSLTTQIDFVSKFLRELVSPLIGRFVIDDNFIGQLSAALNGGAETMVERGIVRDLQIVRVFQDELNPDTMKAEFSLLPLYPLNYINITITF